MLRGIDAIQREPWAITQAALELITEIADRHALGETLTPDRIEALEQKLGRPLAYTHTATERDGVAIIPVMGPLFRHANLMTEFSGATSYGVVARDLRAAVDNPMVDAIVLHFETPGGQVSGVADLAKQIRAVRGVKPIVAFVEEANSGGYWLAAQTDKIVASETAILGSVGAMINVVEDGEPKDGRRRYRFVSSQSPNKNAAPSTEAGARQVQRIADDLGGIFVQHVADGRGTTVENVLEKYGQGGIFVAADALDRGMIDEIGTFEGLISSLQQNAASAGGFNVGVKTMSGTQANAGAGQTVKLAELTAAQVAEHRPDLAEHFRGEGKAAAEKAQAEAVAKAQTEAQAAERSRITDIQALAVPGADTLISAAIADGSKPEQVAMKIVQAMAKGEIKPAAAAAATVDPKQAAAAANKQHLQAQHDTEDDIDPPDESATVTETSGKGDAKAQASADVVALRQAGIPV